MLVSAKGALLREQLCETNFSENAKQRTNDHSKDFLLKGKSPRGDLKQETSRKRPVPPEDARGFLSNMASFVFYDITCQAVVGVPS